jgi:hypothetical protein
MVRIAKYAGQALVLCAIGAFIAYFANAPAYQNFPAGDALIKLTFVHGGAHVGGCRERTVEELDDLAPNMRRPLICPRERLPVLVELDVDGTPVHRELVAASGLHSDGPAVYYESFPVPAGSHRIDVRLRDSDREEGFDYVAATDVMLAPAQLFVVQFRSEAGGFLFQ